MCVCHPRGKTSLRRAPGENPMPIAGDRGLRYEQCEWKDWDPWTRHGHERDVPGRRSCESLCPCRTHMPVAMTENDIDVGGLCPIAKETLADPHTGNLP